MTNEELTAELAELKSALFAVGDLAQTLAAEIKRINERQMFALDSLQGTSCAQEAVIHALMAPLLRNSDLNQKLFQIMFDGNTKTRRAEMAPDALKNFDTTVNSARQMFGMLIA